MKKSPLIPAAAAIAFNLGVLVVAGRTDTLHPIKSAKADVAVSSVSTGAGGGAGKANPQEFHYTKILDASSPALALCMRYGGTVVKNPAGERACKSKQVIPGAVEIVSWSFGDGDGR